MTVEPQASSDKLPFDFRTSLLSMSRDWRILLAFAVVSLILGAIGGKVLGSKTFEAETILRFRPVVKLPGDPSEDNQLLTLLNTVKIPEVLGEARERLGLSNTLQEIGRAINVSLQKSTSLMIMKTSWKDADVAVNLVRTVRDIFIERQRKSRQLEASKQVQDTEKRLAEVVAQLKEAEKNLQDFTVNNRVIDLDKEALYCLEQLNAVDLLYEEAKISQKTLEIQTLNLRSITEELKGKIAAEADASKQGEDMGILNIRIGRLRDAISEDKQRRANIVDLNLREQEYLTAVKLSEKGLISKAEVEKAKALYERQKSLTVDTEQTSAWKQEVERLNETVLPNSKGGGETPTGPLLRDLMFKAFNLELEKVAVGDKVKHLEAVYTRVKSKLEAMPKLQRDYAVFSREVVARETEKKKLEEGLAEVRIAVDSSTSDFLIVADAEYPRYPVKSNRKMIAIVVVALGLGMGLSIILGRELLTFTIRSGAELTAKTSLPCIGVLPVTEDPNIFPDQGDSSLIETFRAMTHSLRFLQPKKGLRLLIVSALEGEGKTLVTVNLGCCWGRTDEHVLLIDAQVRDKKSDREIAEFIRNRQEGIPGLGEYLSYEASEWKEVVYHAKFTGVSCLPRVGAAVIPDFLGSARMTELLDQVAESFSIVLIEAPPVLEAIDAEILASNCDAALLVVESGRTTISQIRQVAERLQASGIELVGGILNGVEPLFISSSDRVAPGA